MSATTIRNIILSTLIILLTAGAFIFMVYQIRDKEAVLQEQLDSLNEELARGDSFYKLQKVSEESSSDRERLNKYFLHQDSDSIDVLNWFESAAPKAHVVLQVKNLQKITDKDTKTDWVEIALAFSGERADVERFVAILEHLPYLSYITTVSMSARSSTNWEAQVTMRVYIYSYDK